MRRAALLAGLALALLGGDSSSASAAPPGIKHVFIIVLENENFEASFGPQSPATYLSQELPAQGAFLPNYYAIGHLSLDNYIAMVSGQAPNVETQSDCQFFTNFSPGTPTSDGQYVGQGCVYPPGVANIANQLEGAGLTWKGYMEDMNAPTGQEQPCRHPAIGAQDNTQTAEPNDMYAARHNPFVYFHSIIDFPTCVQNDVDLSHLAADLQSESTTPSYSFIVPNLCNDGHDEPCVNGQPGGLAQADGWLRDHVPQILHSPGYKDHGLLIVTFDEAEAVPGAPGGGPDASACCNEQPGPNTANPGGLIQGPGGGKIGTVMLSPCIKPGTVDETPYNHYSMLRSIEDLFGLSHLGYAGQQGLEVFDDDVFTHVPCVAIDLQRKPRKAEVGERTRFRFHVGSDGADCIRGVEIRFAGKRTFTNEDGNAKIRTTLKAPRRYRVRATKGGCEPDSAKVRGKR
ncbi:MAG TPA: alkaline phosphatase family protein [Solirubrobacterales bacterium]|nr:alkaline phosphatase family protein [Solirubrobacterales bacterium]